MQRIFGSLKSNLRVKLYIVLVVFCLSACHSNKRAANHSKSSYNCFNNYVSEKRFNKNFKHYYANRKSNSRKRITPRFFQDKLCITFLKKKVKQPKNSLVKVTYPYDFVFLFFGAY